MNEVIAIVKYIELQQCQMYVVAVVAELERTACYRKVELPFLKTKFRSYGDRETIAKITLCLSQLLHAPRKTAMSSMLPGECI